MFQPWRIKLREVDAALKAGRLDDACRLLGQGELRQFYPAQKLAGKLAQQLAARGQQHVELGESSAGWRDMEAASELGASADVVGELRRQLIDQGLAEAQRYLEAGNVEGCLARIDALKRHGAVSRPLRELVQVAQRVKQARSLQQRGEFAQAEEAFSAAQALRPDLRILATWQEACRENGAKVRSLSQQLHRALGESNWSEVQAAADELLELAPQCETALEARRRAWNAVGARVAGSPPRVKAADHAATDRETILRPRASMDTPAGEMPSLSYTPGHRFLIWIDGVGGFLVCEGNEVVLGQPAPGGHVDVPILGDLSRQHARISRQGEGYLITPVRSTHVNGRRIEGVTSLVDGSRIELGSGVRLTFRRPHPLCASARLEFASFHRTQPAVDAVLLLADSCILGPGDNFHVPCRNWSRQVVLFRQGADLWCRTTGTLEIDGVACSSQGRLAPNSRVVGEDFSFCLEEIG